MGEVQLDGFDNPIHDTSSPFSSIGGYLDALKTAAAQGSDNSAGQFYSFIYKYKSNRTDGKSGNSFAFYDSRPLVYLFDSKANGKTIECLNFHFLPVDVRMAWLDVVNRAGGNCLKQDKVVRIPPKEIRDLKFPGFKNPFAVRHYSMDRIAGWTRIRPSAMWDLCKWTPETYGQVTYKAIRLAYLSYHQT